MKYIVETSFPYSFYPCTSNNEAKKKRAELRKKGKHAYIVCQDDNGNDYILE